MEEFSQSRGDDDLFDDEIVPIEPASEPVETLTSQVQQVSLDSTPTQPAAERTLTPRQNSPNIRGRGRGRGRVKSGPSRDQHKPGGLAESKYAVKPGGTNTETSVPTPVESQVQESAQSKEADETSSDLPSTQQDRAQTPSSAGGPPANAPTAPANPTPSRPPAVRGDRTSTGGVRKPKLTEAELNEKLAAAKERSQNLAAAHARAQADADSFAERERIASVKRTKEREERKAMEGEREKNRERKLRALGGREWDADKDENDHHRHGSGRMRLYEERDHKNTDERDLSMYEWKEDRGRGGRGGRGRGRGGGGGRGGGRGDTRNGDGSRTMGQIQPDVNAEADFPALPGITQKKPETLRKDSEPLTSSWADQVESSEAARKGQ